jgi:REP element-mobilizing transposase RayT
MPQSFACLHHHLIFSTHHRTPSLDSATLPRLFEYIGGILRAEGCALVAAGGMHDHVHLLASLTREISVAAALRLIKANSSKWIHETDLDRAGFAWQAGYGAFAVSYSHLDQVKAYLDRQAEHHRTMTFQEEFRAFLERHDIRFDERYLWE